MDITNLVMYELIRIAASDEFKAAISATVQAEVNNAVDMARYAEELKWRQRLEKLGGKELVRKAIAADMLTNPLAETITVERDK